MSAPIDTIPQTAEPTPPSERFWRKWSPNHEFSVAWMASGAIHIIVIGLFLIYIAKLLKFDDKTPPPIIGVTVFSDPLGGLGGPGSEGGSPKEAVETQPNPMDPMPLIKDPKLSAAQPLIASWTPELANNPDDIRTVMELPNFEKLSKVNEDLRRQLAKGLSSGRGKGNETGKGNFNQKGSGDGTPGDANSTARRTLRWTIQFSTTSGRDYLDQLMALKATLLIPQPPSFNKANIIRDLSRPNKGDPIDDVSSIRMMMFIDDRVESVSDVCQTLQLGFVPPHFIAFFPKDIEDKLATKEKNYRNRNPEDILSTTFRVLIRDKSYEITVTDQVAKR